MTLVQLCLAVALTEDPTPEREASRVQERRAHEQPTPENRFLLGTLYARELLSPESTYGPARDLLDTSHDGSLLYGAAVTLRGTTLAHLSERYEQRARSFDPAVATRGLELRAPIAEPPGGVRRIRRLAPQLQHQVVPEYPPLARQARIQGIVRFRAVIDREGRVTQLSLESGHPLLVPAALSAVKQWQYQVTRDLGEAVEVDTALTIHFELHP